MIVYVCVVDLPGNNPDASAGDPISIAPVIRNTPWSAKDALLDAINVAIISCLEMCVGEKDSQQRSHPYIIISALVEGYRIHDAHCSLAHTQMLASVCSAVDTP